VRGGAPHRAAANARGCVAAIMASGAGGVRADTAHTQKLCCFLKKKKEARASSFRGSRRLPHQALTRDGCAQRRARRAADGCALQRRWRGNACPLARLVRATASSAARASRGHGRDRTAQRAAGRSDGGGARFSSRCATQRCTQHIIFDRTV
jgi:hypothetical protein